MRPTASVAVVVMIVPVSYTHLDVYKRQDVDILDAVAAKFGVKTEWQVAQFPTLLLGVQSGKYDVGMSLSLIHI